MSEDRGYWNPPKPVRKPIIRSASPRWRRNSISGNLPPKPKPVEIKQPITNTQGPRWGRKTPATLSAPVVPIPKLSVLPSNIFVNLTKLIQVSVVMAVHNTRPEWLREAVDSVKAQTLKAFELILVDDASSDPSTIAELDRLADTCRLIRLSENVGAGPARNEALKIAQSDLIAIMDSDDVATPYWLKVMVKYYLKYLDVNIISPSVKFMDRAEPLLKLPEVVTFDNMAAHLPWIACHPGMIFRRKEALAVGGYGTTKTASDLALWRKMLARGSVLRNVPDKLIHYRIHTDQLTNRTDRPANLRAVMAMPVSRRKRLLVGSYFLPDANSAGGGPNIYIDSVKYLEERDDLQVKWIYAIQGEMRENNKISPDAIELRHQWQCEKVKLGDKNAMVALIKQFKPDLIFPLGWQLAGEIHNALKITDCKAPVFTRVEHVNFSSGEMSIDRAQSKFTKTQHQWQLSVKDRELNAYRQATALLCVSQEDTEVLQKEFPQKGVFFVPPTVVPEKRQYDPKTNSKDVVFLGGTWHRGNIDALIYLMRDVWPLVKAKSPSSKVKVCGVCGPGLGQWNHAGKIVGQYKNDIEVLGFVEDLGDVFENIACSVAPVITGGGVKIKLQTSFSYRCPCITTPWVADEFRLGPKFAPMIGKDPRDYAKKILDVIQCPKRRQTLLRLVDSFNSIWSPGVRNAKLDKVIPRTNKRILTAANCLTLPIRDISTQLFQARSDTLVRLLRGETIGVDYKELAEYFKPGMVTALPKSISAAWDVFIWSNMVDETTRAVDFHSWPFGPNHSYGASLIPEKEEEFFNRYPMIPKPTLKERAKNYCAVNELLLDANPNVRRIVLFYETARFFDVKPHAAKSYVRSAEHMAEILQPLGWEIHSVPPDRVPRSDDAHWAHYDIGWTKNWLLKILAGRNGD